MYFFGTIGTSEKLLQVYVCILVVVITGSKGKEDFVGLCARSVNNGRSAPLISLPHSVTTPYDYTRIRLGAIV